MVNRGIIYSFFFIFYLLLLKHYFFTIYNIDMAFHWSRNTLSVQVVNRRIDSVGIFVVLNSIDGCRIIEDLLDSDVGRRRVGKGLAP